MNQCYNHKVLSFKNRGLSIFVGSVFLLMLQVLPLLTISQVLSGGILKDGRVASPIVSYPIKGTDDVISGSVYISKRWLNNQVITTTATAVPSNQPAAVYENLIMFSLDEDHTTYIPSDFTATVTVDISYRTSLGGTLQSLNNQILTIDYKKGQGAKSDVKQYISFAGAPDVTVTVKSFSFPALSGIDLKDFLILTNEIREVRHYNALVGVAVQNLEVDFPAEGIKDELPVKWSIVDFKTYSGIQVEWAWLENEFEPMYHNSSNVFVPIDFLNQTATTRIELPGNTMNYRIPLLYGGVGKVHFRVRGISVNSMGNVIQGPWTLPVSYSYTGHESSLNWQSVSSYSEEGKRKTAVEYFDGNLRSRQLVTKDNTINKTITAETMYDGEGRPAINVLPAPGVNDYIRFNKNLNLFVGQTASTQNPAELFDLRPLATTGNATPQLQNTIAGSAAQYYSQNNPDKANEKSIPDADGYPYTVTRYTPDATGRVAISNNVGNVFRMGQNREVKYFYGNATQEELDGLFGTDVGDKSHYSKNMIKDENGQMSVSYVDMHGRTIATALAGNNPGTLTTLALNNASFYPNQNNRPAITSDILGVGNTLKNNKIESVNTILVPMTNNYTFTYQMSPPVLSLPTCDNGPAVCYTTMFDLEIAIVDESGDNLNPVNIYRYTNVRNVIDTACSGVNRGFYPVGRPDLPGDTIITIDTSLMVGSYSIRKTLTLNEEAFTRLKADYLKRGYCVSEQELIDSVYSVLRAVSGCDDPAPPSLAEQCNDCMNALGTEEAFRINYLLLRGMDTTYANIDDLTLKLIHSEYLVGLNNCNQLCELKSNVTNSIRQQMLMDMYPFAGQYALNASRGLADSVYRNFNIFNATWDGGFLYRRPVTHDGNNRVRDFYRNRVGEIDISVFPVNSGVFGILPTLSKNDFAGMFKNDWTNSLLPHHPEYERLIYAENVLERQHNVFSWQLTFDSKSTYAEALAAGFIYTSLATINDTLFTIAPAALKQEMSNRVNVGVSQTDGYSLWQLAYIQIKCGSTGAQNNGCTLPANFKNNAKVPTHSVYTSLSTLEKDLLWNAFKVLYAIARTEIINKHISQVKPLTMPETRWTQFGYRLHFPSSAAVQASNTAALVSTNPENGSEWTQINTLLNNPAAPPASWVNNVTNDAKQSVCDGMIEQWRIWLLQCPTIADHPNHTTIVNTILSQMAAHCNGTQDNKNPYGASTHPTTNAGFEQIITTVLSNYSIAWTDLCNPYIIEFPKPYGRNKVEALVPTNQLDSCECDQFAIIKSEAVSAGKNPANLTSLNEYLRMHYDDTLNLNLFNALSECNTLGSVVSTVCETIGYNTITHPCGVNPCDNIVDPMFVPVPVNRIQLMLVDSIPKLLKKDGNTALDIPPLPCYEVVDPWGVMPGLKSIPECVPAIGAYLDPVTCRYEGGYCDPGRVFDDLTGCCLLDGPGTCTTQCPITQCTTIYKTNIRLAEPEVMPKFLDCNASEYCLDCTGFKNLVTEFKNKFSGTDYAGAPYYLTGESLTDLQVQANTVLAKFFNFRTGFQYTWEEYFAAMQATGCEEESLIEISSSFNNIASRGVQEVDGWVEYGNGIVMGMHEGSMRNTVTGKDQGVQKTFAVEVGKRYRITVATSANTPSVVLGAKLFHANSGSGIDSVSFHETNGGNVKFDFYPIEDSITFRIKTIAVNEDSNHTGSKYVYLQHFYLYEVHIDSLVDGDYEILCLNSYPLNDVSDLIREEDPCLSSFYESVELAELIYKTRTENLLSDFTSQYLQLIRNTGNFEKFTVTTIPKEYHYTLYYYDQAGNMVKAVSPRGVIPNYTPAELEAVSAARKNNVHRPRTHTHTTLYRYNSLNQVIQKQHADEGLSKYWYDELGRLVLSQNANQATTRYSYTLYDAFNRVIEVGQLTNATALTAAISRDADMLESWMNAATSKEQITYSYYDQSYAVIMGGSGESAVSNELTQQNLRKRVSYTAVKNNVSDVHYDAATFYSYDIHGNVKVLMQDFRSITLGSTSARFKKIEYDYDLISGKVNEVAYQPGAGDAFYHRYRYDAENRLTEVFTSRSGLYWERDAAYAYYRHGPLSRTVIGQQQVQGIDYAYTLQGWLKGVNSTNLATGFDIGLDGHTTGNNRHVGRDTYGFALAYYDITSDYDYKVIDGVSAFVRPNPGGVAMRSLFNGNVSTMMVNLGALNKAPDPSKINTDPLLYRYHYDQLNRIITMQVYKGLNANNTWTSTIVTDYRENYTYNPNGSITALNRMGAPSIGMPTFMDRMNYQYYPTGGNRLRNIADTVAAGNYDMDIDNQAVGHYVYDAIGNLIKDGTTDIHWNVYGKIKSIVKDNVTIDYSYDATGNRISKKVGNDITLYVRDATGNVMSVYNISNSTPVQNEVHLYGSNRLGINMDLTKPVSEKTMTGVTGGKGIIHTFTRGEKFFELSNHLGNVLATVSDKKIAISGNGFSTTIAHFEADVVSASDYSPFGMQLVGRNFSTQKYRYGFNGKENDNEVKGNGNHQDYGMRIYDPRLGRFLSVDPLANSFPWYSPYQFAGNTPIAAIDLDGEEQKVVINWYDWEGQKTKSKIIVAKNQGILHQLYKSLKNGLNQETIYMLEGTKFNSTNAHFSEGFNEYAKGTKFATTLPGDYYGNPTNGILTFNLYDRPKGSNVVISFDPAQFSVKDDLVYQLKDAGEMFSNLGTGMEAGGYVLTRLPLTKVIGWKAIATGKALGSIGAVMDIGSDWIDGKRYDATAKGVGIILSTFVSGIFKSGGVGSEVVEPLDTYMGRANDFLIKAHLEQKNKNEVEVYRTLDLKIEKKQ